MLDPRLVHVVAVAREGSFTAAANAVGVTQSAITRSIADLERRTHTLLFHRTPRGAVLTEEGRDFVQRAARVLADARELLDAGHDRTDRHAGRLHVAICPASLEWLLVDPVAALLRRHPSVRIDVAGGTFERVVQLLRTGAIDVAVGYDAAFRDWPDIARAPLAAIAAHLFVRQGHPLLALAEPRDRDLAQYDLVSPSDSRPFGAVFREFYQRQGVDWQARIHTVDFFPLVQRIVAQTDAIGVVAHAAITRPWFVRSFAVLGGPFGPLAPAPLCCATRTRWEPKPAARAFIDAVTDALRASLLAAPGR